MYHLSSYITTSTCLRWSMVASCEYCMSFHLYLLPRRWIDTLHSNIHGIEHLLSYPFPYQQKMSADNFTISYVQKVVISLNMVIRRPRIGIVNPNISVNDLTWYSWFFRHNLWTKCEWLRCLHVKSQVDKVWSIFILLFMVVSVFYFFYSSASIGFIRE